MGKGWDVTSWTSLGSSRLSHSHSAGNLGFNHVSAHEVGRVHLGENKWEAQDLARASGRFPPALHPQCSSMWHVLLGEQQLSVFINIRESEFNKPGNNAIQI